MYVQRMVVSTVSLVFFYVVVRCTIPVVEFTRLNWGKNYVSPVPPHPACRVSRASFLVNLQFEHLLLHDGTRMPSANGRRSRKEKEKKKKIEEFLGAQMSTSHFQWDSMWNNEGGGKSVFHGFEQERKPCHLKPGPACFRLVSHTEEPIT